MDNLFIDKIRKNDLENFISICKLLKFEFDEVKFQQIVNSTLKYLNGDKSQRDDLRVMQEMENSWYESLKNGSPDYSVYDNVYYLADTWVCWKKYSREYLKRIQIKTSMGLNSIKEDICVNKIVDLGCGIGYSTAALKDIFKCEVYGTNIRDTKQFKICEIISQKSNFKLVDNLDVIGSADMVFASEYFEHFEKPVEHLVEVISKLNPKYILFANTFNAKSIGHFDIYYYNGLRYNGRQISKMFNKRLISLGFKKVETSCWNNRPSYYKKYGE